MALQAVVMAQHRHENPDNARQPLEIILKVANGALRDEITDRQLAAAIAAAPYCHARLNAVALRDVTEPSAQHAERIAARRQALQALLGLARPAPLSAQEVEQHRDVIEGAVVKPGKEGATP